MSILLKFIDIMLHLDKHLQEIVSAYPVLSYGLLFLIIFLETGLVVTPFLPGDSLLFAAGALAATGAFNIWILYGLLFVAAVAGDTLNYHIGKAIGPKVFSQESSLLFNKKYLLKAQAFYEKHGKKTIILARFVPIIRTFAPFVAGIGTMSYRVFILYNIIGGFAWCTICLFAGYLFGNIPWVKNNFGIMVLGIIFVSVLPIFYEFVVHYMEKRKGNPDSKS